ncbi:response regulator [Geobacter sp.]|uniref:response regulator n=1 Tax=Geobacter sp. TaxID=46610 RepID=UPI00260DE446|nr:response regulator [Geobacter sp.]
MYTDETQTECGDFLFVTELERCAEIEKVLTRGNLKVAHVESGGQALATLAAEPWTVMVADTRLPDMDGVELARAALAIRSGLFVFLGDADPPEELGKQAAIAGVAGIVHMPYEPDELLPLLWFVMQS